MSSDIARWIIAILVFAVLSDVKLFAGVKPQENDRPISTQDEPGQDQEIDRLIARIRATKDPHEIALYTRQLQNFGPNRHLRNAHEVLRAGLKSESADVRYESFITYGTIGLQLGDPCPIEIIDMAADADPRIQDNLVPLVGLYERLPPSVFEWVNHKFETGSTSDRLNLLVTLAKAGPEDPRVHSHIREQLKSRHLLLRGNAIVAEHRVNPDVSHTMNLYLDLLEDATKERERLQLPNRSEDTVTEEGRDLVHVTIAQHSCYHALTQRMSEQKAQTLAFLQEAVKNSDVNQRRRIANYLQRTLEFYVDIVSTEREAETTLAKEVDWNAIEEVIDQQRQDLDPQVRDLAKETASLLIRLKQKLVSLGSQ